MNGGKTQRTASDIAGIGHDLVLLAVVMMVMLSGVVAAGLSTPSSTSSFIAHPSLVPPSGSNDLLHRHDRRPGHTGLSATVHHPPRPPQPQPQVVPSPPLHQPPDHRQWPSPLKVLRDRRKQQKASRDMSERTPVSITLYAAHTAAGQGNAAEALRQLSLACNYTASAVKLQTSFLPACSRILKTLVERCGLQAGLDALDVMERAAIKPDAPIFTILIARLGAARQVRAVERVWERVRGSVQVDLRLYNAYMAAMAKCGRVNEVLRAFKEVGMVCRS